MPSSLTTLLPIVLGFSPHLPVSVCGTGDLRLNSGFSRQCGICGFATVYFRSPSGLRNKLCTSLQSYLLPLVRLFLPPDPRILLCPRFSYAPLVSIGISTDCPSPTPLGLSLGPDLPWADEPSPGNLRLSTVKILTLLSLLIPAFSLLFRPHVLTLMLLPVTLRSPTNTLSIPRLR